MPLDELNEYLTLFSNRGKMKVQVKFQGFNGTVVAQTMEPEEIARLVSKDGSGFLTQMTFDEWPFEVYKYEIDPIKSILTIRARKQNS